MQVISDSDTLRKMQLVQLEILLEVDRICKKHDIKYQLHSGTLLGAIRHKGFIPWDDDVDICVLRKDYEKLMELMKTELYERYFLQTYLTEKNYMHSFAQVRKNNTIALQKSYRNVEMHHGIFIDIFQYDNIAQNRLFGKIQKIVLVPFGKLKRLKMKDICLSSRNRILTIIKLFIHYFLMPINIQTLNKIETRIASYYSDKETDFSTLLIDNFHMINYEKYKIKNKDFYNTIEWEFEGHLFPVPFNYHEILTKQFGDYMEYPPLEEQTPHHNFINICFDTTKEDI